MKSWTRAAIKSLNQSTVPVADYEKYFFVNERLIDPELQPLYYPLHLDDELVQFLTETPRSGFWDGATRALMGWWMTNTDMLGYIGRGSMHVLSKDQIYQLIRNAHNILEKEYNEQKGRKEEEGKGKQKTQQGGEIPALEMNEEEKDEEKGWEEVKRVRLLDVGAGSGHMTEKMIPFFEGVVATELSSMMVRSLRSRNITTVETGDLEADEWLKVQDFDTISCLNVLDRCDEPITLLHQIRQILLRSTSSSSSSSPPPPPSFTPLSSGLCMLAIVIPFCPFVETTSGQMPPSEYIRLRGNDIFETAVNSFVEDVLTPCGFRVLSFSRVPYVSIEDAVYVLDNCVFMLAPQPTLPIY